MVSKAQARATQKYETNNYDKVLLRIRKDGDITREMIQKAAEEAGESLNEFIMKSIRNRLESH